MNRCLLVLSVLVSILLLTFTGCSGSGVKFISQERVQEMLASGEEFTLLDVRTEKEYEDGHIPGSVLLPIEDIREGNVVMLPDRNRKLVLYCRTGRRAEDAAVLLMDMGYSQVYSMGGIVEWTGEVDGVKPSIDDPLPPEALPPSEAQPQ